MQLQVVFGRANATVQSVAKRSPQSRPIHITPHLSMIDEGAADTAEYPAMDVGPETQLDVDAQAAVDIQHSQPMLPLPEDVHQALQVSFD